MRPQRVLAALTALAVTASLVAAAVGLSAGSFRADMLAHFCGGLSVAFAVGTVQVSVCGVEA